MGRKAKLTQNDCQRILLSHSTAKQLAEQFDVSVPTIYNVVNKKPPYNFPPNAAQASPTP
jgi:hypothetical protein